MLFNAARKLFGFNKIDLDCQGRDGRQFTPDLWKLEQHEWQLFFVPDVLMSRHPHHDLLEPDLYQQKPLCSAYTADDGWGLWKHKLGEDSYAIPLINKLKQRGFLRHNTVARIKGELVAIRPRAFIDLDIYYQNRLEFLRFRSNILIPFKKRTYSRIGELVSDDFVHMVRAWMYMGISNYWYPLLDAGATFSPVQSFEPKKQEGKWFPGRYFYWSLNEYKDS